MGWNVVEAKKESILFTEMYDEPRFYQGKGLGVLIKFPTRDELENVLE